MKILGISCFYHDSAATLIVDGQVVAAAAEERFSRLKHDNSFPYLAIEYCLQEGGLAINELDAVAFYEKPIWKFERLLTQYAQSFPKSLPVFIKSFSPWLSQKLNIQRLFKADLNYHGQILFVPHHLAHAAESYYLSPFKEAALVTLDGVGEWATTTISQAKNNKIEVKKELRFPHSLGLFYSTLTAYLGFRVNNDEYKVMGLAAYGDPEVYAQEFDQLITINENGSFTLNLNYFDFTWSNHMPAPAMEQLFQQPIRQKDEPITQKHKDIAAALQNKLEEVVFHLLTQVQGEQKSTNLCLGGGVALNSVMNGKILSETPFTSLYIAPDPSDAGGAMGAAFYCYFNQAGNKVKVSQKQLVTERRQLSKKFSPYLGPSYQWHEIRSFVEKRGLTYRLFTNREKFLSAVVDELIEQKVIGWFQGRMEWGPRALGNRSILTSAVGSDIQDVLNAKVKHREMFRPFAPVILDEAVDEYFQADQPLPKITKYMLTVYPFKKGVTANIPGVVHINNTGRLQSIARNDNPLYYDLIKHYQNVTGIPILINTSFNVRGEPIVCTPNDSLNCFLGTGIDLLVMDQAIIRK